MPLKLKHTIKSERAEKLAKIRANAVSQLNDWGVSSLDIGLLDTFVDRLKLIVDNKDVLLVFGADESELETVTKTSLSD